MMKLLQMAAQSENIEMEKKLYYQNMSMQDMRVCQSVKADEAADRNGWASFLYAFVMTHQQMQEA